MKKQTVYVLTETSDWNFFRLVRRPQSCESTSYLSPQEKKGGKV